MNRILFTCGDINGIGPEIVVKTLNRISSRRNKHIFIVPGNVFRDTIKLIPAEFSYDFNNRSISDNSVVTVLDIGEAGQKTGEPTAESGRVSFSAIRKSFEYLNSKKADAVVTAPISKTALLKAKINYPGHTEMFASWCDTENFVMMFLSRKLNIALLTIHEPIAAVPALINKKMIKAKTEVVINTLQNDLGIHKPGVAVLGMNPHAGEGGRIGKEEMKIISPALVELRKKYNLAGPFPADAFFANKMYRNFDAVISMYHDQALIPFKLLNFHSGVNYTAGLSVVRTSPDHGVAYDIAGKANADESSMVSAYNYALKILRNRNKL
ncbi:MAG: 4-hydroxythreonine-4-phosphate dehydrogenase PdxA [Ignavibacteriaceae bacterium]